MCFKRLAAVGLCAGLSVVAITRPVVQATNHDIFFNEVMAGANGDSRIQFIEITQRFGGQNCWGPQVRAGTPGSDANDSQCFLGGANETASRAMLVFFDAQDREIGRYKFPENPPTGLLNLTTLIATEAFANLPGAPVPDLIMPPLLSPISGKVCLRGNPENPFHFDVNLCLSYGGFVGDTELAGPPAGPLPLVGTQSLQRPNATNANSNSEFALGVPSPRNVAGQTFTLPLASQIIQGETLFNQETFMGNGRTCAQCHIANESFRLTPFNVQLRFANIADSFETQFIAEAGVNLNTLVLTGRPTHQSGTDFNNTSGGDLRGIITGSGGGRGQIAARIGPLTYLVIGGIAPPLAGTLTDASGNTAVVDSITPGGLDALEAPVRMRTSTSAFFPAGRALILENIDGFLNPPVFRKSPHLVNLSRTGPFGFSGDIPDLRTFTTAAVIQHLPRTLARTSTSTLGSAPDFRLPTADELAAMEAFMNANEFPRGNDPDKFNLDRFVTTPEQDNGRELFFGTAKCSQCHGGPVLAQTTVSIQGKPIGINAAFNTGVMNQPINSVSIDNLPCEPSVGVCNSREFSTPQLFNVKNLGPWFHDGSAHTLRAAVEFYDSPAFNNSPAGVAIGRIDINSSEVSDIVAFLESISEASTHTITGLIDVTTDEDVAPAPLAFTVAPADASVSAVSLNPALVPNANIVVSGSGADRTITVTPAPNQFGSAVILIGTADATGSGTGSFLVTVNGVADTPAISAIPDIIFNEDEIRVVAFTVSDPDGGVDGLVLSTSTTNPALHTMSVSGAGANRMLTITPAPDATGSATITITASDGVLTATRTFFMTVNPASSPLTISPLADVTVDEDSGTRTVGLAVISTVESSPHVLDVGASTSNPTLHTIFVSGFGPVRTMTLTPSPNQSGTATITVFAFHGGHSASRTFTYTVNSVNDAPTISVVPDQTFTQGIAMIGPLTVTIGDVETPAASLALTASSSNQIVVSDNLLFVAGVGANRTITLLIQPTAVGTTTIALRASDGLLTTTRTFNVTVALPPPPAPAPAPAPPGPAPGPPPSVLPPGAPSGLSATVRGNAIDLTWTAAPDQSAADGVAAGYRVEVGTGPGLSNTSVFTTGSSTSFTVTGLVPGSYFIRVRAFNGAGNGDPSNEVALSLGGSGPRNLQATVAGQTVQLSWLPPDGVSGVSGYLLEVGSISGAANLAVVPVGGLSISVNDVRNGTYFVRVKALTPTGLGSASNEVIVTVGGPPLPCTAGPNAPRNVTATVAGTVVQISWLPPSAGAPILGYVIQVGTGPGLSNVGAIPIDGSLTSVTSPAPDGTYFVRLTAANACGVSGASNEVSFTVGANPTPPAPPPAPGAPSNLTAQVVGGSVTLIWAPPVSGGPPARYIIDVTDSSNNPVITVDTGSPATAFSHAGAPAGVYVVRVRAANAGGIGPPSAAVTVTITP